jgi:hypothetical protein
MNAYDTPHTLSTDRFVNVFSFRVSVMLLLLLLLMLLSPLRTCVNEQLSSSILSAVYCHIECGLIILLCTRTDQARILF